jgi:hypothetical protein
MQLFPQLLPFTQCGRAFAVVLIRQAMMIIVLISLAPYHVAVNLVGDQLAITIDAKLALILGLGIRLGCIYALD